MARRKKNKMPEDEAKEREHQIEFSKLGIDSKAEWKSGSIDLLGDIKYTKSFKNKVSYRNKLAEKAEELLHKDSMNEIDLTSKEREKCAQASPRAQLFSTTGIDDYMAIFNAFADKDAGEVIKVDGIEFKVINTPGGTFAINSGKLYAVDKATGTIDTKNILCEYS